MILVIVDLRRGQKRAAVREASLARQSGGGEQAVATSPAPAVAPKQAILVDDSPAMRSHLGRVLDEVGYRVEVTGDGRNVLERLAELTSASLACGVQVDDHDLEQEGWQPARIPAVVELFTLR